MPPKMKFVSDIWHPNIHKDGEVCISILHPPGTSLFFDLSGINRYLFLFSTLVCHLESHYPTQLFTGDDKWGYEDASERWLPIHTVETIIISVISMLSSPNDESPANIEAAVSLLSLIRSLLICVERMA